MNEPNTTPQLRAFRLGPRNRRLEDASNEPTGYEVIVEADLSLPELLDRHGVLIAPDEDQITAENFPQAIEPASAKHLELFDFSARSDYGRRGVDEAFVRDKLNYFNFRPATLVELICFSSHLRETYRDQWFEAKTILALGSVLTTAELLRKGGWFRKEIVANYRHYPEFECVSGRPQDVLRLSRTERDSDGNWAIATLFLATALA